MSLQRALFALIAVVLLTGLLPSAIAVDRRLEAALEDRTRQDLALAPRLLAERRAALSDAQMMHAKELAGTADLVTAVVSGDRARAVRVLEAVRALGGTAVLVGPAGKSWVGDAPPDSAVNATRHGAMPVVVVSEAGGRKLSTLALAPIMHSGRWVGAAGLTVPLDTTEASALAGLTRSEVLIVGPDGTTTAGPFSRDQLATVTHAAVELPPHGEVSELRLAPLRYLAIAAPLGDSSRVVFVRDLDQELAPLTQVRRLAGASAAAALAVALVLGALFAAILSRPVRGLAAAAARLATGDFDAPIERSRITEVQRVAHAFDAMRRALAARLEELQAANAELEERQHRLAALQAELIQRDRLATAGRLVAQLAHEIRNPVANVRNCLEIVRRRVAGDAEAREFADLAIDELLRMHELAEQMLDLNRPRDAGLASCDAAAVARDVATLLRAGAGPDLAVLVSGDEEAPAAITPDALKQVLLNVAQNAREATSARGTIAMRVAVAAGATTIDVSDSGPGIPTDILPRIFDPFVTTKSTMHGVGLGLFVADGMLRGYGGRITASNGSHGGARFRIELPRAANRGVAAGEASGAASGEES